MWRWMVLWVVMGVVVINGVARAEGKPDPVAAYKEFLKGLPKDDLESIRKARWKYFGTIAPLDLDTCAKAFLAFLDFHDRSCEAIDKIFWAEVEHLKKEKNLAYDEAKEALVNSDKGRLLLGAELDFGGDPLDGYFVRGVPEEIPCIFSPHLPKSIRRYLELRQIELREGYFCDAALSISYGRLAQRITNWEDYLKEFPNSLVRDDVLIIRASYLWVFLFGMSNTPLDPKNESPDWNIQIVYKKFMRDYPATFSAELVRKNFDFLQGKGLSYVYDEKYREEITARLKRSAKLNSDSEVREILWGGRNFSRFFRAVKQTEFVETVEGGEKKGN